MKGEIRQRLEVTPPVFLNFPDDLELFAPGTARPVVVEVTSARAGATGKLVTAPCTDCNAKRNASADWKR